MRKKEGINMKKLKNVKTTFGSSFDVCFQKGFYNNGNVALIVLFNDEYGLEEWCDLSVNITSFGDMETFCANVNDLNCDVLVRLEEVGAIKNLGYSIPSGYCDYPVYQITDKFNEYVVEGE